MTGFIVGSVGLVFGFIALVRSSNTSIEVRILKNSHEQYEREVLQHASHLTTLLNERMVPIPIDGKHTSQGKPVTKPITINDYVRLLIEERDDKLQETTRKIV